MKYTVTGAVDANHHATFNVKGNSIAFGVMFKECRTIF